MVDFKSAAILLEAILLPTVRPERRWSPSERRQCGTWILDNTSKSTLFLIFLSTYFPSSVKKEITITITIVSGPYGMG
jgi:hypothetical protein